MSDEIALTDITPVETEQEKAAREAAEAEARAEADRIAAEEARLALADSQKEQALRILRTDYYLKGRDPELLRTLNTLEPEAVAYARSIHEPQVEKVRKDSQHMRSMPSHIIPDRPSKPSKRSR